MCSGDKDLIAKWSASGDLPNLRRLMDEGLVGSQQGLPGVYVGAHWPSWSTGCHPGKTRIHSWQQLQPGTYRQYQCRAGNEMQRRTFWDALSEAGQRVCVLDIPHSHLSPHINGIQTVEWGAHDGAFGFRASSPELEREILSRFGRHPVSGNSDADRTTAELIAFRDDLVRGVRMKRDLTRAFYGKEQWNFFAQVFTEAHCGGHLLWHMHDPAARWHRPEDPRVPGDPLKDVYVAIDEAIGAVLEDVDPDATVIFLANQGMGPKNNASHLLDRMLVGLGYAAPAPTSSRRDWRARTDTAMTRAWQSVPAPIRNRLRLLRDFKRKVINPEHRPARVIDPAAGKAFTIVNNTAEGAIRVNLVGREPEGKVQRGAEYEAVLDSLTRDLMAVINLETGTPIVAAVHRCDDLYPGPERHHLPDLFVTWRYDAPVNVVGSPRLPRLEGRYAYVRSGDHRPEGMFVVKGPGVRSGRVSAPVRCTDFAPTILQLLGVAPPADLDSGGIAAALAPART
jgi:predicted AlkP superfamily phosphohydrolase/phosphomutase